MPSLVTGCLIALLFTSLGVAEEVFELQKNDYPASVLIRWTEAKGEFKDIPYLTELLIPIIAKFGYVHLKQDDAGQFGHSTFETQDGKYPRYLTISTHKPGNLLYLEITTMGERGAADGYSGHSDDFAFYLAKLIKPLINKGR